MDFEVRNERDASVWLRNDSTGTDLGEVQQGATEWFQAAEGEDVAARDASGNIVHVYSVTPRVPLWTVGPALGGLPVPLRTYDGGPFSESLQSTGFLNGAKALKAAMLFVDFDDVPASSTPSANEQAILQRIVGNGPQWLRDESFGAADLAVTPFPGWRRMPKKAAEYA
ncbi:MAG: hypothetical protein KDD47_27470, partial [Acidobacteria bacterium]|nr:hypothetical protein [Acidobacteriota bacterium]